LERTVQTYLIARGVETPQAISRGETEFKPWKTSIMTWKSIRLEV